MHYIEYELKHWSTQSVHGNTTLILAEYFNEIE